MEVLVPSIYQEHVHVYLIVCLTQIFILWAVFQINCSILSQSETFLGHGQNYFWNLSQTVWLSKFDVNFDLRNWVRVLRVGPPLAVRVGSPSDPLVPSK